MESFGLDNTYSSLHPVLRGDNPDSSFSEVCYEKGFQLLYYLESLIGRPEMKEFLRFYMREHSLTSITTIQLRETWEFFVEYKIPGLSAMDVNNILMKMDWSTWLYQTGLAPVWQDFNTVESDQSAALARAYISLGGASSPPNAASEYNGYYSNLKVVFHDTLQSHYDQVNLDILERIDADLNCTADLDPEVRQRWYPTGLGLNYEPVYEPAHKWISSMGRSKYLTPVYASLQDSDQHDTGCLWFEENKDFYHPVAATSVSLILGSCGTTDKLEAIAKNLEQTVSEYADIFQ